jgi:hypothetical protein
MKRLLTGARKLTLYRPALLVLAVTISLIGGLRLVRSQDPATEPQTKEGKTRPTLIVPGGTVNAGEVIFKPDTDHDGMTDEDEAQNGTNPNDPSDADGDADGDGLTNGDEVAGGSGVNSVDSDGDGVNDGEEVSLGYNPIDANSTPPPSTALASLRVVPNPINLSINTLLGQEPVALRVTGVRTNGTTFDLTGSPTLNFQSLDENVAVVDGGGNVAGTNAGATSIRVASGIVVTNVPVVVTVFSPSMLSELIIPGYANNVDVAGNYAYVAAGSAGLVVVDVNDRSNPVIVATLDTPGNANDIRVVGTRAYVADGTSGLQIIDISTPGSPAILGSLDTPGDADDVVVAGTRAYLADGSAGLRIIDVSTPAAPTTIGSVFTGGSGNGVAVSGDWVVLADGSSIRIIDAAVPASPTVAGIVAVATGFASGALDVEVRDRFAYVATFARGLRLVDFSVPTLPRIVGGADGFDLNDVALANQFALGADFRFTNFLPIFDLADPGSSAYSAGLILPASGAYKGTGLAVTAQHVYLTGTLGNALNNGVSGTTRLFIVAYQAAPAEVTDTGGIAPTVSVDSPQSGESTTEGDTITISMTATDDVKVATVQLIVNGVVVTEDSVAAYNVRYAVPHGVTSLVIEAKAFDVAGNSATSPPVTINVLPDPPPTIAFITPAEGQVLTERQTIFIAADANDNREIAKVVFSVNGTILPNFSFYTVPRFVWSLTFVATATDDFGQTASVTNIVSVVPDPSPTITIIAPAEGTELVQGQVVEFIADASDNTFVSRVEFKINGQVLSDPQAPYRQLYTIPTGTTSLILEATAVDNFDQRTVASRTFTVVTELGTTVIGRVLDTSGQPVSGATARVGQLSVQTGADGNFTIPNVPTAQGGVLVRVTATIGGQPAANASLPTTRVPGGATDVGVITLSTLPAAPTAFGLANYDTDFRPDVFVGYPDRQSLIYSFNGSQFTPNANYLLPYGAVSSGANLESNFGNRHQIFAQLTGRSGSVTDVTFDSGTMQAPATVTTGLDGESEYTAAALDASGPTVNRPVLGFLKNSPGGTLLSVRFGNGAVQGYNDPVFLPVDSAVPLRTLTVADINNDGLMDLIVVKPDTGNGAKLVVYLRTSASTFGSPVESPITLRATVPAKGAVDFVLDSLAGNSNKDIAVLGDDRVRIYQGDGVGGFVSVRDIIIPAGRVANGLTAFDVSNDGRSDIIVTTRNTTTPTNKEGRVYLNTPSGVFLSPTITTYTAPISAGDTRIGVGKWGGISGSFDMVVVDGDAVKIFFDIGPAGGGS